ncbi:MAG: helix-turn-helix domain-containing protein [Candidatus Rokuibacteriota bacterium]
MADKPLIDKAAVAERLGTTERHVRQLVTDRRIPFVKVGRSLRFDPAAIEEWIAENSRATAS